MHVLLSEEKKVITQKVKGKNKLEIVLTLGKKT